MRWGSLAVGAALIGAASTGSVAEAQTVRIRAITGADLPVVGALVSLRRANGTRAAQALTDENGRATLRASAGTYRVRGDRIGFVGINGPEVVLAADDTTTVVLRMPEERVILPELTVSGDRSRVCRINDEAGTLMAALWSEARKALQGAELTRLGQPPLLEVTTFERDLDVRRRVKSERSSTQRTRSTRPFASLDPAQLIANGFVEDRGSETWYYGPDANLLLSDQFVEVHCFTVRGAPKDAPHLIGLAFEPTKGRRVPEIKGTLWLDRSTAELRFLEFEFTNLRRNLATGNEGGRVEFERLPTGGWIVSDWAIVMPLLGRISAGTYTAERDTLLGLRETGGRATVIGAGTEAVARNRAVVSGTVFDSTIGRPLAGVVVTLGGGSYRDTTDEDGRYRIETPTQGSFLIEYRHPRLDALGMSPLRGSATLTRGHTRTADAAVPGFERLWSGCGQSMVDRDNRTMLAGIVRDSVGQPLPYGAVEIGWSGRTGRRVTVAADGNGRYLVCGAPANERLWIRTARPRVVDPHTVTLAADSVRVVDLMLTRSDRLDRRSAVVVEVRKKGGGAPIADALVSLDPLPDTARTDAAGIARLPVVPAGRFLIGVRSLGHEIMSREIVVPDRDTARVTFELETVAQRLAELEVKTRGPRASLKLQGFEERRVNGMGTYFTRADLAEKEGSNLVDILRLAKHIRLVPRPNPCWGYAIASVRTSNGPTPRCAGKPMPSGCYMALFIDGFPRWLPGQQDPPDLEKFRPFELEAVEVYGDALHVPMEYRTVGTECGMVMLWTRD